MKSFMTDTEIKFFGFKLSNYASKMDVFVIGTRT